MTHRTCEFDEMDCPEPENYAAIAKQLHETALEAEERIYCIEQQLRAAVNRPTYMATSTAVRGPITSGLGEVSLTVGTSALSVTFTNMGIAATNPYGYVLPAGIWHVGATAQMSATGAVTAHSSRRLIVRRGKINPSTGLLAYSDQASRTAFDAGNGVSMMLTVSSVFRFDGTEGIYFDWSHGNLASTVQVDIGATMWFTKLSDSNVVRVI
jgi:hypothetical protein